MQTVRRGRRTPARAAAVLAAGVLTLGAAAQPAAASDTPPTPHNFLVTGVSDTSVSMQWSPGAVTWPTHWRVIQDGEAVETSRNSAQTVGGLTPGDTYSFAIVAVDGDGDTSAPTRTITVTTRGAGVAPGAPADPRAVEVDPARVTVEFDRPGDEFDVYSYYVFDGDERVAVTGKSPYAHPTGSATVRGLEPDSTHTFTVRAYRADGMSAPSAPLTLTTPASSDTAAPTVPTGVEGSLAPYTCQLADLTWQESTDDRDAAADLDYEVFVEGELDSVVQGESEALSVVLPDDTGSYTLTVRAVDSSGNASAHSDPVTVTIDPRCRP